MYIFPELNKKKSQTGSSLNEKKKKSKPKTRKRNYFFSLCIFREQTIPTHAMQFQKHRQETKMFWVDVESETVADFVHGRTTCIKFTHTNFDTGIHPQHAHGRACKQFSCFLFYFAVPRFRLRSSPKPTPTDFAFIL